MNNPALKVENLIKKYDELSAVNDISFDVYQGEVFGLLGPNGAGKTTVFEIIEGLREKTSGNIEVLGINSNSKKARNKIQEKIGIQLQSSSYFQSLKLIELLELFGSFYSKHKDPLELLKKVHLEFKKDSFVENLSGGQAQRFSIVAALVNDPDVVFLDEPTTGLDPKIRRELWTFIQQINKEGKTVILTTHYMEEAQVLCDRIAIMNEGKIVATGSPQSLIDKHNLNFKVKFIPKENSKISLNEINKFEVVKKAFKTKDKIILEIAKASDINVILNWLEKNNIYFKNLEVLPPTLEDVFLTLTGSKLIKDD